MLSKYFVKMSVTIFKFFSTLSAAYATPYVFFSFEKTMQLYRLGTQHKWMDQQPSLSWQYISFWYLSFLLFPVFLRGCANFLLVQEPVICLVTTALGFTTLKVAGTSNIHEMEENPEFWSATLCKLFWEKLRNQAS